MKIFSGSANEPLAEKIAKNMNLTISARELFVFPDGERRVQIQERVVDEDCVVVQPTATPVDENYMELFFLCDGLKRSGARSVTLVIPYLGYQRQDHVFRTGEAVSLEVVIKFLEEVGIDRVIAFDFHSVKIPELFKIPVDHLSAMPLFAEVIKKRGFLTEDTVLVSPDMGGIRRVKILSELLDGMTYAAIEKERDLITGKVEARGIEGKTARRAIIVDDMISSGSTMIKAAELLISKGTEEVYVFATHAIFSADAPELLEASKIAEVYVTDTVYIPKDKYFAKLNVLSVGEMIAREIEKITQ